MTAIVSFADEPLILVDENDRELGHMPKEKAHLGGGVLHRAFSLFIFNGKGQVLLQKRAPEKMLWGGYWSNSVCSHPRRGEDMDEAVQRRLLEELGIECDLTFLYKFQYQAPFDDVGSENELCWVYAGKSDDPVTANENEIAEWKWVDADRLADEIAAAPDSFTPWMKMEWQELQGKFKRQIESLPSCPPPSGHPE